jgi:ribosomal subunit interface protein
MQVPLEISCPDFDMSDAVDQLIRAEVDKLERFCDYMISCRVTIERPHRHRQQDNPYRVRIDLRIPHGHEILVKRESIGAAVHEDLYALLRSAFDTASRRLRKLVAKQHGDVKEHGQQEAEGVVARVFDREGYGFIESVHGYHVYFHRNSVLNNGFARLQPGTPVRFIEEEGNSGPQAQTVQITDKHGAPVPSPDAL